MVHVPEHILDLVAERAKAYTVESKDRWLAGYTPEQQGAIQEKSTHHLVDTAERRELHRKILEKLAENLSDDIPEQSKLIAFIGPMGSGKSTLREEFDTRLASDDPETPYDNDSFEVAFQHYKKAIGRALNSDFQLFKQMLPEFAENNNEFAIIRAEASALDQALRIWAKELKTHIVIEQLGDRPDPEALNTMATDHQLITIAVTADPVVNAAQLHARNAKTGQVIDDAELARTIKGFSEEGYQAYAQKSHFAVLADSDPHTGFEVIHAMKKGRGLDVEPQKYATFLNRGLLDEKKILERMKEKPREADATALVL